VPQRDQKLLKVIFVTIISKAVWRAEKRYVPQFYDLYTYVKKGVGKERNVTAIFEAVEKV